MIGNILRKTPGILFLLVIGFIGLLASEYLPVNHLILVIIIGIAIANTVDIPDWAEGGVGSYKILLEAGIVLLGTQLVLDQVLNAGTTLLLLVIAVVFTSLLLVELISKAVFSLEPKMGSLLATGASICGVSAIVATAGGIKAKEDQIAYAVATILLFDAITIFLYPILGSFLNISDQVYGIWAGVSMFSTGPATAAGFTVSDVSGQWATLTKLTRNVLIGGIAVLYSMYYARGESGGTRTNIVADLWDNFPKFIIGFVFMISIASIGYLSQDQITSLEHAYKWLFTFAFAGLGLNIKLSDMRDTGSYPILIVSINFITISTISLIATYLIFT